MKIVILLFVCLTFLLSGCTNSAKTSNSTVELSGVVIDGETKQRLSGAKVELYQFKQPNPFVMGTYVFERHTKTTADGSFGFSLKKGNSIQIIAKHSGKEGYQSIVTLDNIQENYASIVVELCAIRG